MLNLKTILHPTDFSACSDAALQLAGALARDHGAKLMIMHVAVQPVLFTGEGMVTPVPQPLDLESIRSRLSQVKPIDAEVSMTHVLVAGDPVTEILRVADESKCDLIVMGTAGRRGLSRLVMGSVAEQVVRRAPCPVVTEKTPLSEILEGKPSK